MTVVVYALNRWPGWIEGTGLHGLPLQLISEAGISAVVTEHAAPPARTPEVMWEYERVVERLMSSAVILPMRFGSLFADDSAVRIMLRRRHCELRGSLERVAGAVEFAVSAGLPDRSEQGSSADTGSGTAYLLERLDSHRQAAEILRRLESLEALARSSHQRLAPERDLPLGIAYLVDRDRADEFAEQVQRLGADLDDIEMVCTGPWPPYSFAQEAAA